MTPYGCRTKPYDARKDEIDVITHKRNGRRIIVKEARHPAHRRMKKRARQSAAAIIRDELYTHGDTDSNWECGRVDCEVCGPRAHELTFAITTSQSPVPQ